MGFTCKVSDEISASLESQINAAGLDFDTISKILTTKGWTWTQYLNGEGDVTITGDNLGIPVSTGILNDMKAFAYLMTIDASKIDTTNLPSGGTLTATVDGNSVNVADYTYSYDSQTNKIMLSVVFSKLMYTYQNITAGATSDFTLINEKSNGLTPNVSVPSSGSADVTITGLSNNTTPYDTDNDGTYRVIKSVEGLTTGEDLTTPTATYEIHVATNDKKLNGKTILDEIPAIYDVTGVTVTTYSDFTGSTEDDLDIGATTIASISSSDEGASLDDFLNQGGDVSYKFETLNQEETNKIMSADITVAVRLSESAYGKFLAGSYADGTTVENSADLLSNDEEDQLAEGTDTRKIKAAGFDKNGSRVGNSDYYKWNIEADTYFSSTDGAVVYIVDHISDTSTHQYVFDNGTYPFQVNGTNYTVHSEENVSLGTDEGSYKSYSALTIADLTSSTGDLGSALHDTGFQSGNNAYMYTYVNQSTNKTEAVLLIPVKGAALNSPVSVNYYTKIGNVTISNSANNSATLQNDAKLLWSNVIYGDGPYPAKYYEKLSLKKNVTANYQIAAKEKAADYNEKTQELTWNIVLNDIGRSMSDVLVTDSLTDSEQQLISPTTSSITATVFTDGGAATDYALIYQSDMTAGNLPTDITKNYYNIISNNVDKTTSLLVYIPSIDEKDTVTIQVLTKLVDIDLLSEQITKKDKVNVGNRATVQAKVDGTTDIQKTISANIPITNTLPDKTASGTYNHSTKEVAWKLTANQNFSTIENPVLTDTLQVGTTIGDITKVEYYADADTDTPVTLSTSTDGSNDAVVVSAADIPIDGECSGITGKNTFTIGDVIYTVTASNIAQDDSLGNQYTLTITGNQFRTLFDQWYAGNKAQLTDSGFTFEMPTDETLSQTAYLITFDVLLVDSVSALNITNSVDLYGTTDSVAFHSDEIQAANASNFNFEDYATASNTPMIRIQKTSTNASGMKYYPLEKATFSVTKMKYENST